MVQVQESENQEEVVDKTIMASAKGTLDKASQELPNAQSGEMAERMNIEQSITRPAHEQDISFEKNNDTESQNGSTRMKITQADLLDDAE